MSAFNEANTVEAFVRDRLCGGITHHTAVGPGLARRRGALSGLGWHFLGSQNLGRQPHEVLVESHLREALLRLNPEIAALPDRADDVLYRLRAILMGVRGDGLVKANEEFTAWVTGERSMPFGENGEHLTTRLIDFEDGERNQYVATSQYTVRAGATEKRADLVLLVNGIPLVVIEAKTPVRASQSWFDAATQIHDDYERNVPELFVPNVVSIATEGKEFRYGSIGLPLDLWGPWRIDAKHDTPTLTRIAQAVDSMLRPHVVLDLLASFTAFATDTKKRRIKIVARHQQYEATNQIVERVVAGHPKKGLIWHFQGSGKSLLMLFAARKLRLHPALKNPTVMIVVDRIDLDTQISSTFHAADTERDKYAHFVLLLRGTLQNGELPRLVFRKDEDETVRYFPDKLPIGVDPETDRHVFVFLAIGGTPMDFRQFLLRHQELLGALRSWTIRVVLPRERADLRDTYEAAVYDQLAHPLPLSFRADVLASFQCRRDGQQPGRFGVGPPTPGVRLPSAPALTALYRRWLEVGNTVVIQATSLILRDALQSGRGAVECIVLSRGYAHLSSLAGTS